MEPSTTPPVASSPPSPRTPEEVAPDVTFKHKALANPSEEIRLLRFAEVCSLTTREPRLAIEVWSIHDAPPYAAISYTWGGQNVRASVFVNGDRAAITWSCRYVLQQLGMRQEPATAYFWIDSICIDQQNLNEKSLQVVLMQDIYRHAHEVLACIGPHADDSDLVFEVMAQLDIEHSAAVPTSTHSDRASSRFGTPLDETIQTVFKKENGSASRRSAHERFAHAYLSLARRQYWSRMWIIQELWLPKTVRILCGCSELLLSKIAKWALACRDIVAPNTRENYGFSEAHQLAGMDVMIDWLFMREEKLTHLRPWNALQTFYPWESGNFRDRVYALLGITTWAGCAPVPNYSLGKLQWLLQILDGLSHEEDHNTLRNDIGWLVQSIHWRLHDHDAQMMLAKRQNQNLKSPSVQLSKDVTQLRWRPNSLDYVVRLFHLADDKMGTISPRNVTVHTLPQLEPSEHFRRIQEDGSTVGYVPTSTTDDDFLFVPGHPRMLYLVLREIAGHRFSVVGYALYMPRTRRERRGVSDSTFISQQSLRPPNFMFDSEDALAFALFDQRLSPLEGEDRGAIDRSLIEYIIKQPATRSPMSSYGMRVGPD